MSSSLFQSDVSDNDDDAFISSESSAESLNEFDDNDEVRNYVPERNQRNFCYPLDVLIRTLLLLAVKLRNFLTDKAVEEVACLTDILFERNFLRYTSKYH